MVESGECAGFTGEPLGKRRITTDFWWQDLNGDDAPNGINTDDNANEFPDHLACQLEFMSWLAHLETSCGDEPELQQGYQCAQRDFLQRHLQPFLELLVSELQQKASQPRSNPFYLSLAAGTLEVTDIMLEQLEAALAATSATDTRDDPEPIAAVNLWG